SLHKLVTIVRIGNDSENALANLRHVQWVNQTSAVSRHFTHGRHVSGNERSPARLRLDDRYAEPFSKRYERYDIAIRILQEDIIVGQINTAHIIDNTFG